MTPARLVIVTCANRGMGLEVVGQLARRAARFGVIDRRIREVTSRLDALYTLVTLDS
jgi:NAD(P)-dependent dehydrogenase (short-subunit alcohol dehydrogenase family)